MVVACFVFLTAATITSAMTAAATVSALYDSSYPSQLSAPFCRSRSPGRMLTRSCAPRPRHRAVNAVADGGAFSILDQSPFVINYIEVLDPDLGVLSQPAGISITASGYIGLFIIALNQLFAPWGYVQYSKRLEEDEQGWLDAGAPPDQAVIRALNNQRPPARTERTVQGEQDEGAESESGESTSS